MKTKQRVFEVAPDRLHRKDDFVGKVICRDLRQPISVGQLKFSMLQAERKRRARRNSALVVTALASAASLLFLLSGSGATSLFGVQLNAALRFVTPSPQVEAEKLAPKMLSAKMSAESTRRKGGSDARVVLADRGELSQPSPAHIGTAKPHRPSIVPTPEGSTKEIESLKDCASLAQEGSYEQASQCYGSIAKAGGSSAELANLEQVRVLSRAMSRPAEAQAALDDYAQRFPEGALRGEAALTRLDLLASTGQDQRLIVEVDEILKSKWAPERRADLLLSKAEAQARSDRCPEALRAVSQSESAGGPQNRIALVREHCRPTAQ